MTNQVGHTLIALLVVINCCEDDGYMCDTGGPVPAFIIEVRDKEMDSLLTPSANGFVQDGDFIDSLKDYLFNGEGIVVRKCAAYERPGVYDIYIQVPDYLDWDSADVLIFSGRCHVQKCIFTAYMHRVQ